jgi:hypothetical protein
MVCLSCETIELIEGPANHSHAHQRRTNIQAYVTRHATRARVPSIHPFDALSVYALSQGAHVMVSGAARRRRATAATRLLPTRVANMCAHVRCCSSYTCAAVATLRDHAPPMGRKSMFWEETWTNSTRRDAQTTRGHTPASSSCFSNFSLRAQASAGALSLVKSSSENCKPDYHFNAQ